ncbi:response regulator transcription factor [Actinomadura coerulea]|uniref:response regulator transcription factor n=1 Tax=Actinomadura coerulea TaxID=46159 RepID=UPI00343AA5D8
MSIKLFVVDDHPIVLAGDQNAFVDEDESELVGAATSLPEAVAAAHHRQPNLIVLDVRLGATDVTSAVTELRGSA